MRIGYWPNNKSLVPPGDRRRFVFYAKERNIDFELASTDKEFDVVYITSNCNCTEWIKYKKDHPNTKLIFELIDSYLLEDLTPLNLMKGVVRFVSKKESKIYIDYRKAFIELIKVSDAVVCSTPIQQKEISKYNNNIHVSLDYFSNDITVTKQDFQVGKKLKLVWEGQAYTVHNLLLLKDVFEQLKDEIELHIITDPVIKFPFKVFNKNTVDVLKTLDCDYTVHNWEKETFSKLITSSDLAVIPIDGTDKLMWNKPENKMLLLWEIGIPVFATPTPAYHRVMNKAGVDGLCATNSQWLEKIRRFKNFRSEEREQMSAHATSYLKQYHSKDVILAKWDAIFESVWQHNMQPA